MVKESIIMLEEVAMKASMIYMNFSVYTKFIFLFSWENGLKSGFGIAYS